MADFMEPIRSLQSSLIFPLDIGLQWQDLVPRIVSRYELSFSDELLAHSQGILQHQACAWRVRNVARLQHLIHFHNSCVPQMPGMWTRMSRDENGYTQYLTTVGHGGQIIGYRSLQEQYKRLEDSNARNLQSD